MTALYHLAKVLFLCLVAAAPEKSENFILNANDEGNRIIGSYDAEPGEFPHHVSLHHNDNFFCGGSLIQADKVLTSAQCCNG